MPELHPYVLSAFAADPIRGSGEGHAGSGALLPDVSPEALAEHAAAAAAWRSQAESTSGPGTLDSALLLVDLRRRELEDQGQRPWARAPYWYAERAGAALTHVMEGDDDGEQLLARLSALPAHLSAGGRSLEPEHTPTDWAQMGVEASTGLLGFLTGAVATYAATLPPYAERAVVDALPACLDAVETFAQVCRSLTTTGQGSWVAGRDHLDAMLGEVHHAGMDSAALAEHGAGLVEAAEAELVDYATGRDPSLRWAEQIDAIKDDHPQGADFLSTYDAQMAASKAHTTAADLLTLPPGEDCQMAWVPEFLRASLPLGVMHPVRPFSAEDDLSSVFLITPLDERADPDRQAQHRRDNCHAFTASIAGHETYPGHHVQHALHKRGTARDSVGRLVGSVPFVEGWGLYVEDLLEETGFMDDAVALFRRRNNLWRSLRVVVDMGLHTGTLSVAQATELMQRRAGMGQHMAAGEVRRYTRHDNPTYPSSYVLGREEFHRLRERWWQERPGQRTLREYHDAVLGHGSPPHALLEPVLFAG